MKVGLIVPGGVDRSGTHRVIPCLLWLIERLARQHELHVFALFQEPRASQYDLLGATVHTIDRRLVKRNALKAVLAEHRRRPFDVIHAFWAGAAGALAALVGKLVACPVLLHLAGGELVALPTIDYGGRRTIRGRAMVRFALWGAARVTAACPAMIAQAAKLGVAAERLVLGVDLERWPPSPPRRRTLGSLARLIHVASLNRVKDQSTLLRAMARLRDLDLDFHLDIVGEDTLHGEMHRLTETLSLEEHVTFRGFLPHSELGPLLARADLLLLSSLHEGCGVVILEAAVAGVPVVGTRVGHIAAWTPDAAVAVPVGDDEALAGAVMALLKNENRRLAIAREAQRRAIVDDADATASRVNEIYEELVAARKRK